LLARRLGYSGRIVSVEPGSEAFGMLRAVRGNDMAWETVRLALGSKPGLAKLHVARSDDLSSLRPLASGAEDFFPETCQIIRTEDVVVPTLDSCFDQFVRDLPQPRVFLKIDTQGYDLEVLKGARQVLPRVEALQVEVSFSPLYEGVPPWYETISWCEAHGFGLYGLFPLLRDPRGQLVEADALLVRIGEEGSEASPPSAAGGA